jgi:peptide/nickel transport system substrate-binding protein
MRSIMRNAMRESAMTQTRRFVRWLAAGAALVALAAQATAQDRTTLRAVTAGELSSLDPVWTTAALTRYYSFMVYDTLFGIDAEQRIHPQMVDRVAISDDKLTYTFTLRPGLKFTDGAPVTAEDVVVSWNRWAERDAAGQVTATFLSRLEVIDANSFRAVLKEPFGQLLFALAKPQAMPMFVMPARVARGVPGTQQISDATGSGPFRLMREQWVAGVRVVFERNRDYSPRAEPASGIAGGKRALVDRVEWVTLPDAQTQVAALQRGEIDFIEQPAADLMPLLRRTRGVRTGVLHGSSNQGTMRVNHLNPPFDNPAARRALHNFILQPDMIMAVTGDPALGQVCGALLICGSPNGSEHGAELIISRDPAEVRIRRGAEQLRAAGYDGRPIVVLHPTDQPIMHASTLVLVDALRRGGINVDLQSMDWGTLISRRTSKEAGPRGWHIFLTTGGSIGPANPAFHIQMSGGCERAFFGWPCDSRLEELRARWVRETDPAKAFAIAEDIQRRGMEITVYIPFGQFKSESAWRDNVEGILPIPETLVFWNVAKK